MRYSLLTISLLFFVNSVFANPFIGTWQVSKVTTPKNYFGEIKYPKYFQITQQNAQLQGHYRDQHDFACDFALVETINAGNELLLIGCGVTKHATSWMPLHKVKYIKGQLVGKVVTHSTQFTWYADAVKPDAL